MAYNLHLCLQSLEDKKVRLSGYGVELAVKSTEYKAVDDSKVKDDAAGGNIKKTEEDEEEVEGFLFGKLRWTVIDYIQWSLRLLYVWSLTIINFCERGALKPVACVIPVQFSYRLSEWDTEFVPRYKQLQLNPDNLNSDNSKYPLIWDKTHSPWFCPTFLSHFISDNSNSDNSSLIRSNFCPFGLDFTLIIRSLLPSRMKNNRWCQITK